MCRCLLLLQILLINNHLSPVTYLSYYLATPANVIPIQFKHYAQFKIIIYYNRSFISFFYTKFSLNKIENGNKERVENSRSPHESSTRGKTPASEADFSCPLNKKLYQVKSNILMLFEEGPNVGYSFLHFIFDFIYYSIHLFFILLACCFLVLNFLSLHFWLLVFIFYSVNPM